MSVGYKFLITNLNRLQPNSWLRLLFLKILNLRGFGGFWGRGKEKGERNLIRLFDGEIRGA